MTSRAEWLKDRASIAGVGASESAALFGLHPQISAFSLFEKLINPRPLTDEEAEEEADLLSFGLAIEPYLADWWSRKTGRSISKPVVPAVSRLDGKPHIFASPDRIVWSSQPMRPQGVLELKSALFFKHEDPLPDHWQVQAQQQMLCCGVESASFSILAGFRRRYMINDIPRNDAFCTILVETIERFMEAVYAGVWAKWGEPIDGSTATSEALRRLYKDESGETVTLPEDAGVWADELVVARADAKKAERHESAAKNKLIAAMGNATFGLLSDGRKLSLKTTKGSTYTVTKDDYRVLRFVTKGKE